MGDSASFDFWVGNWEAEWQQSNGSAGKGDKMIQRMVFYNIQKATFTWDWEMSKDEEATWNLQWRFLYTRKNE